MVKISDIQKKTDETQLGKTISKGSSFKIKSAPKGKKFNDKIKGQFFSELSLLLSSGIDLITAIELLYEGAEKDPQKKVLLAIKQDLVKGESFYKSLKISGKFDQYDVQSIRIGEETGELAPILVELSDYYGRKLKQRRLIIKAISYPLIVLFTAIGALSFMLILVVPMFEDIFARSNNELPLFTSYIIGLSEFFRNDFLLALCVFLVIVFVIYVIFKRSAKAKRVTGIIVLRIPVIGNLLKMFYFEKIYHSLTLLIKARVPVYDALLLVNDIVNFSPVNDALVKLRSEIMKGESMTSSMAEIDLFDQTTVLLVKIGEEVNKLDDVFSKLYKQTSEDLEHKISQFGDLLEPALIILVGVFVAVILIAMYLPIFQLGTSVF